DGTPAGTRLLRDVCPGTCSSNPGSISTFGNRFFFAADDGTRGVEPWLSDGTAAGTRLLRDLCRGGCSSAPQAPRVQGGRAIFTALDAQGRSQLWRTNGTANGTIRLTTLPRGIGELATHPVSGAFLFRAGDADHGDELWRTDGTRPGTRLVADINTMDVGGSFPRELTPLGQEVAFVADGPDSAGIVRPGLWKSGGTAANTVLLGILPPCEQELLLRGVLPDGSFLFLCPEESGLSLWRADGTAAGTFNLLPAGRFMDSRELAIVGSTLFFSSYDDETGSELWVSHGNPGDARQVMDIEPGFLSSHPRGLTPFQGRLFFHAPLLYVTNGTAAGTVQLLPGINAGILGEHDGRLWLSVVDDSLNYALWSTDGTPQGTRHEVDLPGSSGPARLFSAGNRMFLAETGALWISDGNAAGTRRIETEFFLGSDAEFALVGERLFCTIYLNGAITLWQSDGTDAGSGQVLGPNGQPITDPEDLTAFAGRLYFHRDGALWSTDGTPAGTVRIEGGFSSPGELTVAGPRLFFRATDPVHGMELWALE
ncbi:MAG TPA: hypothetical protein VJ885_17860, partial [Thermoanaerobaculia bacterium]|nr:hypothetical protein [Thermoanaerobaculia bacterium]